MRISDWSSDVCSSDLEGVFFPEGGMHAVPVGLAAALEKSGAELRYGVEVDRIVLAEGTSGRVRGVHVVAADGTVELLEADAVVCNPDLPVAYRTLVPGLKQPFNVRSEAHTCEPQSLMRISYAA